MALQCCRHRSGVGHPEWRPQAAAHSSPRTASARSLSTVSLARRLLLLDRNTPNFTFDPSGNASTWVRGTVTEPVRALAAPSRNAPLEGADGRRGRLRGLVRLHRRQGRGQRGDPDRLQALALTLRQGRPHLGLLLLGEPLPHVHAVDREPRQDLRRALFVAQRREVPLPVRRPRWVPVLVDLLERLERVRGRWVVPMFRRRVGRL